MGEDDVSYLILIARAAAPPPLFSLFFLFFSLISRTSLFSPPFSPFFLSSSHRRPHTETETETQRETESREHERERELLYGRREERRKTRVLESSVQSASTAPIDDHPWSDEAEIW
jgi:hypothetical protein